MKWYTCVNYEGLRTLGESLIVAIHSALHNTTLVPNIIYDGPPNSLMDYFESIGVNIIYHVSNFLPLMESTKHEIGFDINRARGAFLYIDLPLIDSSNDIVLFTDADVIFISDPPNNLSISSIAAAKDYYINKDKSVLGTSFFNSGVIYINLASFREKRNELEDIVTKIGFYKQIGGYDQPIINVLFKEIWSEIPQSLNWRPWSNSREAPVIIHTHMLKPADLLELSFSESPNVTQLTSQLFSFSPDNIYMCAGLLLRYLNKSASEALKETMQTRANKIMHMIKSRDIATINLGSLCQCYIGKSTLNSDKNWPGYSKELYKILRKFFGDQKELSILEWGSGTSTLIFISIAKLLDIKLSLLSIDHIKNYQEAISKWVGMDNDIELKFVSLNGVEFTDPGSEYAYYPIKTGRTFDIIYIDGRRRIECAYISSLISRPNTCIILHDFNRLRYQTMLFIFDIIYETSQFRLMRIKPEFYSLLHRK